jgi:hypothetical protein
MVESITARLTSNGERQVDIAAWLTGLGLERYKQAFLENEIDVALLPKLTADDLKDIGVVIVGHRRKLLDAIVDLKSVPSSAPVWRAPALADPAPQPDAERRQLTVMFIDLVSSIPKTCAKLSASIRIQWRVRSPGSRAASRNSWATACSPISAGRGRVRTRPSGRCGRDWP